MNSQEIGCNAAARQSVLVVRPHERVEVITRKNLMIVATAGVVALGYAAVSTNAFADTSIPPTPVVSASVTPVAPVVPTVPVTSVTASAIVAPSGIQAPAGLSISPLSTMPSIGGDDGDDQGENNSEDASINGSDDSSLSVGVSVAPSDDGSDNSGQGVSQDDSGSDD